MRTRNAEEVGGESEKVCTRVVNIELCPNRIAINDAIESPWDREETRGSPPGVEPPTPVFHVEYSPWTLEIGRDIDKLFVFLSGTAVDPAMIMPS